MQGGDRGGPRRYAGPMTSGTAAARAAQDSTIFRALARIGYVVLGVLHIIIGAIAITIAVGGSGEADQSGAVEQVSRAPGGPLLLWVIAIALLALGAWQIAEAFLDWDADAKKRWGQRAKHLGTAAAYFAIAVTATVVALGGQSDSSETTQSFSAQLLAAPGGVVLLVLVGLVVAGVGVGFIVSGIRRSFVEQLALPPGTLGRSIRILGTVGYIAKGIAVDDRRRAVRGRSRDARSREGRRTRRRPQEPRNAAVRTGDPLARRRRPRDLRRLLLRAVAIRKNVTSAAEGGGDPVDRHGHPLARDAVPDLHDAVGDATAGDHDLRHADELGIGELHAG